MAYKYWHPMKVGFYEKARPDLSFPEENADGLASLRKDIRDNRVGADTHRAGRHDVREEAVEEPVGRVGEAGIFQEIHGLRVNVQVQRRSRWHRADKNEEGGTLFVEAGRQGAASQICRRMRLQNMEAKMRVGNLRRKKINLRKKCLHFSVVKNIL